MNASICRSAWNALPSLDSLSSQAKTGCLRLTNGCSCAIKSIGAGSYFIASKIKNILVATWNLHVYPIYAAEKAVQTLNTYVAEPLISAADLTKTYLKNHYSEVLVHIVAWTILFGLCGVLATRDLTGLATITRPMLIAFAPGFAAGILGGIVAVRAGFKYNPEKGGFAEKIEKASDNPFLKAATGATYILAAATIPHAVGAFTGLFLGYKLVEHIVHYPEPEPSHDDRLSRLEAAHTKIETRLQELATEVARAQGRTKTNDADVAERLRQAADLLEHGGHPPGYTPEI